MRKPVIATLTVAAALMGAGAAHAGGNVYWSIGISAPPIGTVISNAPAPIYAPAPVVVAPPPVVYAPPPVVYAPPPPVVYQPPQVVYQPVPRVVYQPPVVVSRPVPVVYGRPWGWRDRDHDGVPNRWDHHDDRYRDLDHDGIPDRWDRYDDRKYHHR